MEYIFIVIAILIVFTIWFLIIKYFLYPLFFKPKLDSTETFEFLEKEKLVFVDKRELNKEEKKFNPFGHKKGFLFNKIFCDRVEYMVVGFSESQKEYRFFWLELKKWHFFPLKFIFEIITEQKRGKKRNLVYKEIKENKILSELKYIYKSKNNYNIEIVLITDKCPACQNTVSDKTSVCPNCGLNLVA